MRTLYQDLRFGVRLLLSSPGFTAVTVFTLALGISATTTVFSWIDSILLHPFPGASDSRQLAVVEMVTAAAPNGANQMSYPDYGDYRQNLKSLAGLALHREDVFQLGEAGRAQAVWGELVSGNYFRVLGLKPWLGRTFSREEDADQAGAFPVAVISHRLWRQRFHGDPGAVGKTLRVNRREITVIGVAPPEFPGTMPGLFFDIWIPATMGQDLGMLGATALRSRQGRMFYAIARLKPGAEIAQARAEALAFSHDLEAAFPKTNRGVSATVLPVWEFHGAGPDLLLKPLRILMAISALVLLIVCANVGNLLLSRSMARRKELSIRLALGAGGVRLARQLLAETLLLACGGTVVGLLLAFWMADTLPSLVPKVGVSVSFGFHLNARILAFTILSCTAATLLAFIPPAVLWFRSDVNEALKEGGRSGKQGSDSHRTSSLLIISEVALAALALIGAGLFMRSFENARRIRTGFDRDNVLLARCYLSGTGFAPDEMQQFSIRLRDRLRTDPDIVNASYADYAPLGTSAGPYDDVEVEGYVPARGESMNINRYRVAPAYFSVLRIPVLEGRDFKESDDRTTAPVIIVNQTFTRRYFQGGNALGRRIKLRGKWATVIGVSRDIKYFNVAEAPRPHFFVPFRQYTGVIQQLFVLIRTTGEMDPVAARVRREFGAADPNAAAVDIMPLAAWTDVTMLPHKVAASLLGALGVISLVLAAVGLYSVMAYAVSQRTQEIGLRMALGAQPRDILLDVLRRGMALTLLGLAAGVAAAVALTRLVAGMLVNVEADDPTVFTGAALFLLAVAMVATYVPARRATQVDPMVTLRCQ